jgi:hypothetical protein
MLGAKGLIVAEHDRKQLFIAIIGLGSEHAGLGTVRVSRV